MSEKVVKAAMKAVSKDVLAPKCVRDGLVKSPDTYYCVFDPEGAKWLQTIRGTKKESTDEAGRFFSNGWKRAKEVGYTVRKVQIIPVEE